MNVRKAILNDARKLSRLSRDVQNLHAQHYADIFKIADSDDFAVAFFEEKMVDPTVTAFIAEEDGEEVGCMLCKLIERPENPFTFAARTLLIDQISVRPTSHGKGIGAALIEQAEILAKELNVQRIHLDSWDFNLNAHGFFEHLGYQKFNYRFWKYL